MKSVYVIGGPNGAGKTTLAQTVLPLGDSWFVFDDSSPRPMLIAERQAGEDAVVHNQSIWQRIYGWEMTNCQRNLRNRATKGVEAAIEKALDRHRRLGEPIAVWQSRKVVTLQPEQIPTTRHRKRR